MSSSSLSVPAADVSGSGAEAFGGFGAVDEDDEEALIQRALEMSMLDVQHHPAAAPLATAAPVSSSSAVHTGDTSSGSMEVEDDDDVRRRGYIFD